MTTQQARRPCVVLVEDHDASLQALARLLRQSGYDVRTAATLAEARRVVAAHGCDLLVADLGLPDGSGIDLMRELRGAHGPGLQGLALTGFTTPEDRRDCLAAGFAAFVPKPVEFDKLLTEVRALVGAGGAAAAAGGNKPDRRRGAGASVSGTGRGAAFAPPDVPVEVECARCNRTYDSHQMLWDPARGLWACPTAGCDGAGFGIDVRAVRQPPTAGA